MKKIIFSKKFGMEKAIENWLVWKIAKLLDLKLTYYQYPTISDQEIEVWENLPKPWAVNAVAFKQAFSQHFGGE